MSSLWKLKLRSRADYVMILKGFNEQQKLYFLRKLRLFRLILIEVSNVIRIKQKKPPAMQKAFVEVSSGFEPLWTVLQTAA